MIEYDEGIHLKGTDIWLDSKKKTLFSFISNANFNQFAPHEKIIATRQTVKLFGKEVKNSVVLECPFNHPFTLGKAQIELIPAGYILGSSQIVVEIDGEKIIYTGDFKLRPTETAESAEVRRANILIMKCTYGIPKYVFPPSESVIDSIVTFVDESLSSGITPVLLVDALGKAQDIVKILGDIGYRLSLHRSIYKAVRVYEEFGISFSNYESFKPKELEGRILLIPPYLRGAEIIERIEKKKIGVVTGWALDKTFVKSVFRADEGFPLSNHADYNELLQLVEITKPKIVYLIHGFSTEFARTLIKRGFNAKPLETPSQLKLL
ncbi:MAG TPA: MBL fold metallo-hydrolase [Thermodesulfobacteriota bacterium]|nr:MBL fold metallo-hydrolase [Thermodesulfobacteriota bacterium]